VPPALVPGWNRVFRRGGTGRYYRLGTGSTAARQPDQRAVPLAAPHADAPAQIAPAHPGHTPHHN